MRKLHLELNLRGYQSETWERTIGSTMLFRKVCDEIHAHDVLVAEISELNANVLVEVGYALAVGRDPLLLVDKHRTSSSLKILRTFEQCRYNTRDEILVYLDRYFSKRTSIPVPNRVHPLLEDIDSNEGRDGAVYHVRASIDDNSNSIYRAITQSIPKYVHLTTVSQSDPEDSLFDNFREQARNIAQASFVVGNLVSQDYRDATIRNATVALLIGLALGFGKNVLVLQEDPSRIILDLGTILHKFAGESHAEEITKRWFRQQFEGTAVPSQDGSTAMDPPTSTTEVPQAALASRARRSRRARMMFFGSPDAHFDYDLMEYFVETPEFQSAANGTRQIYAGRKGVGKSATFKALHAELTERNTVIPVMITPLDLEYEQLATLLERIGVHIHPDFLYPSFWRFIIYTEIVKSIMLNESRFLDSSRLPVQTVSVIRQAAEEMAEPIAMDFSTRIINTLEQLDIRSQMAQPEGIHREVEQVISKNRLYKLEPALIALSKRFFIHIAIDDIDKRWKPNYLPSVLWLRGLLNEVDTIRRRFDGGLTSTVFLRGDMFEFLKSDDVDFANRSLMTLRWKKDGLAKVIAERIRVITGEEFIDITEAWDSLFPENVKGVRTLDYMADRTLMRPRDIIQFCQLALDASQRRGATSINEDDILRAEGDYSWYILEAVRTEYLITYPGIEEAIYTFDRVSPVIYDPGPILKKAWQNLITGGYTWATTEETVLHALYEIGFIGLTDSRMEYRWYSYDRKFEDAMRVTSENRYIVIHPAFHSHLQINT